VAVPATGPVTVLVVVMVPVTVGAFVTADKVVEPVIVENVEVVLVELVVAVMLVEVKVVVVVVVGVTGSPAPMLFPCREETGMLPQTDVPSVTVILDAVDQKYMPFQYWMTVAESAKLSGTHTLAVPVVIPEMATSKSFGLFNSNVGRP